MTSTFARLLAAVKRDGDELVLDPVPDSSYTVTVKNPTHCRWCNEPAFGRYCIRCEPFTEQIERIEARAKSRQDEFWRDHPAAKEFTHASR